MKKSILFFLIILRMTLLFCKAETSSIDSVLKIFNNPSLADTVRLKAIDDLAWSYSNDKPDSALLLAEMQFKFASSINNKKYQTFALGTMGAAYNNTSNFPKALEAYLKSLSFYESIKDKRGIAASMVNVGNVYNYLGENQKALNYYLLALKKQEEIINADGVRGNAAIKSGCYSSIASIYTNLEKYSLALNYYLKALKIIEELDDSFRIVEYNSSIGTVYDFMGDYSKAMSYFLKALRLAKEVDYKRAMGSCYISLADNSRERLNYTAAIQYTDSALSISKEIGSLSIATKAYLNRSKIYEVIGNYKAAYENYVLYKDYKDSSYNIETSKQLGDLKTNFEVERKTIELTAKANAEKKKQQLIILFIALGLAFVAVFALFIFRSLKVTRKQKQIIEDKSKETEFQKQLVEDKNKEITQSITYALRIQKAILPTLKTIKSSLENSFILYLPKDIIAGDFYWMETVQLADEPISQFANENNQLILFAACDCTGHGVPGALVSVVCHNALNRAVREFELTQPSLILDKTAELVVDNFSKSEEEIKDGMDISLIAYNLKTKELQWAGANNPLWIVRHGELIEMKADKQPIGMNDNHRPFQNHNVNVQSGDTLYLFTDGYADQFGGDSGEKKLTRKRFKELLCSIQDKDMPEQQLLLEKFISDYRKNIEQIDDILIIGLRV